MLIINMLRTIKVNHHPNLSDYTNLHLPNNMGELLVMYQNEEAQFIRMCLLSKIKHIIITHSEHENQHNYNQHHSNQQSNQQNLLKREDFIILEIDDKNPNTVFSALFLRFLKRGYRNRSIPKCELKLFYHVMSLAIKYFYNEDQFKFLFNEITELIQNHKERIQTALDFFIEVIATIEYNYEESYEYECTKQSKTNHCKFQRHFTTNHLNSMLMIANFFMEKAILRDNQAIQDGLMYDNFKIKATQEHIHSILQLLHKVLCFDFIGEKYSDNEDHFQFTSIIIPTKNTKYSNLSQFQKWLKNSDWIRIYQFIYHNSQMVDIKLIIIELLGDMARIHMKYFKNKNCYRVHIENIIYALADILQQAEMIQSKDNLIRIAIAVGRNLMKLTSAAIIPIFFDINSNLFVGLLQNIRTFIVEQIIIEEIFNANIIYYFFKFIHNLHIRCIFQKNTTPFQMVQKATRQICRNYQNYFRLLLRKLYKNTNSQQKDSNIPLRQDYSHLKQSFENYDIQQLAIYLSPFKFMKPRYTSANSVQQLFILTCAKFNRSIYIFSTLSNNNRQRQFALQMIEKSILQTIEWFTFTAYFKDKDKQKDGQQMNKRNSRFNSKFQDNFELNMESISEQYGQEIQNQYEYCHMLRVICFFMIQCINKVPLKMYKDLNKNNQIFKLINLSIVLCFQSDLQQTQNASKLNSTVQKIMQQKVCLCLQILCKIFIKQWQYDIFRLKRQKDVKIYSYKFNNEAQEVQFIELPDVSDQSVLLQTINKIKHPFYKDNHTICQYLKKIEYLLAYNLAKQHKNDMVKSVNINSIEDCQYFVQITNSNQALAILLQLQQPVLYAFFEYSMTFFRNYKLNQFNKNEMISYLKALSCMAKINLLQIQQEAINKMFLVLKQVIYFIKEFKQTQMSQLSQLFDLLHVIDDQHIRNKKDLQFLYLHEDINRYWQQNINQQKNIQNKQLSQKKKVPISDSGIKNILEQQFKQQTCVLPDLIKQMQISNPQQIYNGYHREITMSILDKYTQQNKQQQFMDVQPIPQYKEQINQQEEIIISSKNETSMIIQPNHQPFYDNNHNDQEIHVLIQPFRKSEQKIQQFLQIKQQTISVIQKNRIQFNKQDANSYKMQQKINKQGQKCICDETMINFSEDNLQLNEHSEITQ